MFSPHQVDDDWWEGDDVSGRRGLFPANFVQVL